MPNKKQSPKRQTYDIQVSVAPTHMRKIYLAAAAAKVEAGLSQKRYFGELIVRGFFAPAGTPMTPDLPAEKGAGMDLKKTSKSK